MCYTVEVKLTHREVLKDKKTINVWYKQCHGMCYTVEVKLTHREVLKDKKTINVPTVWYKQCHGMCFFVAHLTVHLSLTSFIDLSHDMSIFMQCHLT